MKLTNINLLKVVPFGRDIIQKVLGFNYIIKESEIRIDIFLNYIVILYKDYELIINRDGNIRLEEFGKQQAIYNIIDIADIFFNSQWINIKEKKPDEGENILIKTKNGMFKGFYKEGVIVANDTFYSEDYDIIIGWMPLNIIIWT
jgi:hypothetical protein